MLWRQRAWVGKKKNHRLKLQTLGLIEVTAKPAFTLALYRKGGRGWKLS